METTKEQEVAFEIISNVGVAKSLVMEALFAARESKFQVAEEKLQESKQYFVTGHKAHASLIQKEASGIPFNVSLILMHAEDQLMSTETISLLVEEMVYMYKKFN